MTRSQKEKDELVYRHFNSAGHGGLEDMSIQLIECVKGKKELREKGGHWIYKWEHWHHMVSVRMTVKFYCSKQKVSGMKNARANLTIFCSLSSDATSF